jgi:GcrA cell cycle regulator
MGQQQEWTPEFVGALKRLWAEGNSASKTAEKLEVLFGIKFSRNAIIGKIHRLIDAGKMEPRGDYKQKHDNRTTELRAIPKPAKPRAKKTLPRVPEAPELITIVETPEIVAKHVPRATVPPPVYGENVIVFPLRSKVTGPTTLENVSGCLYSIGADLRGRHIFCNEQKKENSAYCEEHHAKCHIPTPKLDPKKAKKWRPF